MMSPHSFLVSRQSCSPSSSPPSHSPSNSPRSPRSTRHSPRSSPSSSPPSQKPFVAYRRRPLLPPPSWDETLSDTLCIPLKAAAASPPAGTSPSSSPGSNSGALSDLRKPLARMSLSKQLEAALETPLPQPSTMRPEAFLPTTPQKGLFEPLLPESSSLCETLPQQRSQPPSEAATPTVSEPDTSDRSRPLTPTSPVKIPSKSSRYETAAHPHPHKTKRHHHHHHHHNHNHNHNHSSNRDPDSWRSFGLAQPTGKISSGSSTRSIHSPDAIPASVAALLAVTSIPPPRSTRRNNWAGDRLDGKRMTVNAIIERAQEAEQEFSLSLSKSPLDVLLAAPEDLAEDDEEDDEGDDELDDDASSLYDSSNLGTALSTRTVSLESMPSLASSFATATLSSCESPCTPSPGQTGGRSRVRIRGRGGLSGRSLGEGVGSAKACPTRRSLTPVCSPPGVKVDTDPLSAEDDDDADDDNDSLDFRIRQPLAASTMSNGDNTSSPSPSPSPSPLPAPAPRFGFKSNLTASLRALRNAAVRSFPSFHLTSVPPEDFLTRSLLTSTSTIDPRIPYTDERRPPPLAEEPSAALRRYLNPTTSARMEATDPRHSAAQLLSPTMTTTSKAQSSSSSSSSSALKSDGPSCTVFTASIPLQTYRVYRTRTRGRHAGALSSSSSSSSSASSSSSGGSSNAPGYPLIDDRPLPPTPRPRELRENSDFIRIAVMEMAMRRVGKLDERRPGRARLALPPRKTSARPYAVGADGVPVRWVAVMNDE